MQSPQREIQAEAHSQHLKPLPKIRNGLLPNFSNVLRRFIRILGHVASPTYTFLA